jgi:DNA-binding Xre family transcriptional regulator
MNPANKAASTSIRCIMLQRAIEGSDLASKVGLTHGALKNIVCGNQSSQGARLRIEQALDCAIWSTPSAHQSRKDRAAYYGQEIELMPKDGLARLAITRGLAGKSVAQKSSRKALLCLLDSTYQKAKSTN